MSPIIKSAAFILLIIGTIGLLVNELIAGRGRAPALIFAIFNCIGLVILGVTYFGKKGWQ